MDRLGKSGYEAGRLNEPLPVSASKPMGAFWRNVLWALAVLAAAAAAYEGSQEVRRSRLLADGTPAPELSLPRFQGGVLSLAQLKGKVVLLDFWATWCGPCAAEMPSLQKLAREYEGKGLAFVAANHDQSPSAVRDVQGFVQRVVPGLDPYIAFANDGTALAYKVQALPTLYLIDRDGHVVDAMEGQQPEFLLRRAIEKALAR
jgi:cytochrome c biogenesis protein CcmG/thiol:disulfide interchange protein DsbE